MLDKSKANEISIALQATLKEFAKQHGLSVGALSGKFDTDGIKFTAQFGDIAEIGDVPVQYVNDNKKYGWMYNFEQSDVNKTTFSYNREPGYIFCGMQGRKAVIAKNPAGELRKLDAAAVCRAMGRTQEV